MPFAGGVRGPEIDRIFVFWSPEACIADSMTDDGLSKVVSGNTQVSKNIWTVHSTHWWFIVYYYYCIQASTEDFTRGGANLVKVGLGAAGASHESPKMASPRRQKRRVGWKMGRMSLPQSPIPILLGCLGSGVSSPSGVRRNWNLANIILKNCTWRQEFWYA